MQACSHAKGRHHRRNNANDSFGKGFCRTWSRTIPPEAHVIEYARRGGAIHHIELYGRSFTRYFSELGSIFKKALSNSRLPCFDER